MNVSERNKVIIHKKSQSVDFKKVSVLNNKEKFTLIKNKNKINITNKSPNFHKTSFNFNKKLISTTSTNFDFYKTFRNTSSILSFNDFNKKFKFENTQLPYEIYKESTKDIMSEYQYESIKKKPLDISERKLFESDEDFLKIKNTFKRKHIQTNLEAITNEAKLKISVNSEDYKSPVKSLGVLWKNKIIHENISKNNIARQKNKYDEFLDKVKELEKLTKNKHRKIKITTIIPNKLDEVLSIGSSNIDNLIGSSRDNSPKKINTPYGLSK